MIVFLESLRLAFSSLRANPLRAVLTILGIVIGVAAVVALTSIGGGSTKAVVDRFNSFGTDTITVQTSRFSSNATAITQSDLAAIKETPGVKTTVYTVDTNADGHLRLHLGPWPASPARFRSTRPSTT